MPTRSPAAKRGRARDRAQRIEAALQRLARLSEKLLQLARAEGGRLETDHAADIVPVLGMVVDEFTRDADQPGRIDLDSPASPVLSNIDPDVFAILARNLIENALIHGPQEERVRVALSRGGVLRVVNGSPPVPPELLARLSRPFERGQSAANGTGLGLAIAIAVASGTGGDVTLISPLGGQSGGFEARFSPAVIHDEFRESG